MSSVHEQSCNEETAAAVGMVPSFKETNSDCKRLLWRIHRFCCGETTTSPLDDELISSTPRQDNHQSNSARRSLTAGFQKFAASSKALLLLRTHVLIYFTLSIICFSFLVEDWSVIDSLYFATVLFTTIGYGDILPTTDAGRICTMILAAYGIIVLGIFLDICAKDLMEKRPRPQKVKLAKVVEGIQGTPLSTIEESSTEERVVEAKHNEHEDLDPTLLDDVIQLILLELPILSVILFVALFLGHFLADWGAVQSIYWCVMSGTTVGLGDDSPKTQSFRLASVFFLPCTVAVLGQLLSRVAATKMKLENRRAEREYLSRTFTLCDLETMDTDQDGRVDRAEFLAYMLVAIQRVSTEDIEQITRLFNKQDRKMAGFLSKQILQDIHLDDQLINSVRRASISSVQQLPQL